MTDPGEILSVNGIAITRHPGESWRDAVRRIASMHGLADECADAYDRRPEQSERLRAWHALDEWDCLERE